MRPETTHFMNSVGSLDPAMMMMWLGPAGKKKGARAPDTTEASRQVLLDHAARSSLPSALLQAIFLSHHT